MTWSGLQHSQLHSYCNHLSDHSEVISHTILFPLQLSQTTSYQALSGFLGLSTNERETSAVQREALRLRQYGRRRRKKQKTCQGLEEILENFLIPRGGEKMFG